MLNEKKLKKPYTLPRYYCMVVGLEITISLNVHIVYFESCYKEKYDYDRFPLTDIYANINFKLTTF